MSRNRKEQDTYDVIVIGGGASGMFAALRAAERGKHVLIIEKNAELGKKLSITGGGRCNILNAEFETSRLLKNYGDAEKYLHAPFSQFGSKDAFVFFEKRGLALKHEARKRVFPASEKATDVTAFLVRALKRAHVEVLLNTPIEEIITSSSQNTSSACREDECDMNEVSQADVFTTQPRIIGVRTPEKVYVARAYILATGGMSHPETGSTGDGFGWLKTLGHTVSAPTPDLVPLIVSDSWVKCLAGKSLDDVTISFVQGKKKIKRRGRILFTHFGLSGPTILNSSHNVKSLLKDGLVTAVFDLFPDDDIGTLKRRLNEHLKSHSNQTVKNALKGFVPDGFIDTVFKRFDDILDGKAQNLAKDTRHALCETCKSLSCTVTGTKGFEWAIVTDGGISLSEVDTKTMQSRHYRNLYLTGDILNVNRPSGGFSLQLCWTTGWVAGSHV